jgi:membrane-bound lytic murein transglycosylase F
VTKKLLLLLAPLLVAACGDWLAAPLPFPTPAQHDLVVLTRPGPLTHTGDDTAGISGLERDLAEAFAEELGVGVQFKVIDPEDMEDSVAAGRYHIAAAWLSPLAEPGIAATPPLFMTRDVLAQHDASLPLTDVGQLSGKTVHVMAGSRQAATLRQLAATIPQITVVEVGQGSILDLLDQLGDGPVDYVVMDGHLEDLANQFVPGLRTSLRLSDEQPIVWLLGPRPNAELAARASAFVARIQRDGTLARLEERYFGHIRRLKEIDVTRFLGQIETTLPKLRRLFHAAETATGIDWRLIAAVAYQESHWDANATSYTNVRGIMMLTEETADRLKVSNRLDPGESIVAGARYINILREMLPAEAGEPDRTWLALAAYNIGPGHMNGARTIARQLKADPNAWYDMKRILPLLAKPQYDARLKAGRARGGEAVILVENIRSYYDILLRNEAPLNGQQPELDGLLMVGARDLPGLKLTP